MTETVRILIADDHVIVRSGLSLLLSRCPDFDIVGEASDGREAVQKALQLRPDVVIMDLSMPPGKDGISATVEMKRELPDTHGLILTMHDDEEYLFRVLKAVAC
ncbi:MAG: response regulator transcription factor, partial [Novibacillus thermophilus]